MKAQKPMPNQPLLNTKCIKKVDPFKFKLS